MSDPGGRYPLEAARTLRQDAVEVAQRALADALAVVEAKERLRSAAADAVRQKLEQLRAEEQREADRDRQGRSAAEMMTGRSFLRRLAAERDQAQQALGEAEAAVESATREAEARRDGLGQARAEAKAVEKHHEGWESERKRVRLAKEEAEAEEHSTRRR